MKLGQTLQYIYSDYRRYRATGEKGWVQVVFFAQGFWASLTYRFSNFIYTEVRIPVIGHVLRFFTKIAQKNIEILTGISLPSKCKIGKGLYIGHFGTVIVHPEAVLGENCNLSQGVTIGHTPRGRNIGVPTFGDRVFVGPNAIVLGGITIGDDAVIGAGAVVTQSIPALAVVMGNPATIISYLGSFEFVQYDGMEQDEKRMAAFQQRTKLKEHARDGEK